MTEEQINAVKVGLDYLLVVIELNICRENKNEAVTKQDFEKAAEWRAKETTLMGTLPTYEAIKSMREKLNQ